MAVAPAVAPAAAAAAPAAAAGAGAPGPVAANTVRVGFWNVERLSHDSKSVVAQQRSSLVLAYLTDWLRGAACPHVVILCEVTASGAKLAAEFNKPANKIGDFVWEFVASPATDGKSVSPCSFIVISRIAYKAMAIGGSSRRPYVMVGAGGITVAGVHCTAANHEQAIEDAVDYLTDLGNDCNIMLGDMNVPATSISREAASYFAALQRTPVAPDLPYTHQSDKGKKQVLDYAWVRSGDVANVTARPPFVWDNFDDIDHAPIQYDVRVK